MSSLDPRRNVRERILNSPIVTETSQTSLEFNGTPTAGPSSLEDDVARAGTSLEDVVAVFRKWLFLPDVTPVYAALGAVAANQLPGDPVWLGLVAPPSSAKTEILNSTLRLPRIFAASTLTPASLLSGTPKKEQAQGAKGGLLREIGEFGIVIFKDFGSILSMRPDTKSEILGALREIYDGSWTRHLGNEGAKVLTWTGKCGLIFGVTPALDGHHAVMSAMGERFILCRLDESGDEQATRALEHAGKQTATMRKELAGAVEALFASERLEPRELTTEEGDELVRLAALAVRVRSTIERDRSTKEIELVHGAEGPARLVLALERLLAGLDALHVNRDLARAVVRRVALDSVPVLRIQLLRWLANTDTAIETPAIATAIDLPTPTVRYRLQDLAAYGLVRRTSAEKGGADRWQITDWARERLPREKK